MFVNAILRPIGPLLMRGVGDEVPAFIAAQLGGALLVIAVIEALYPQLTPAAAADVVLPHDDHASAPRL